MTPEQFAQFIRDDLDNWGRQSRLPASNRIEAGRMELKLQGRTALITGASRGIGEAIAKRLAAEGCHLALTATDGKKLENVATALTKSHDVKVATHVFDLSKLDSVKRLADVAGDCDILVNNAGAIPRGSLTTSHRKRGDTGGTSRSTGISISHGTFCRA